MIHEQTIAARVYGKESHEPIASECRAILPLPSLLTLADIIVSTKLQKWLCSNFKVPKSVFIGGRPGTQCLDIAFGTQLVVEKGLDEKSAGAISSCDIRRFYDSICVLSVCG